MPPMSSKNFMVSGEASRDLGLGDLLSSQLAEQEEERKKKLLKAQQAGVGLGNAAQDLYGGAARVPGMTG